MVAAWGATNASSPRPMWAADPPRLFSTCASGKAVPCPALVSRTSRAANGGGCSSGTDWATCSAGTNSSIATGGLSMVASSYVSAASSASTWMEGGGGAGAFFANGVPQSKQNLAAGGFRAPQFPHGLSAGRGTESTGSGCLARSEGGGAGGGRRAGVTAPVTAPPRGTGTATRARPVEGRGGAMPGIANGSGGVLSWGDPFPELARVRPASSASSSEIASARSSWDIVSGVWEGGVNASGGVWSAARSCAPGPSGAPQLLQDFTPGTL